MRSYSLFLLDFFALHSRQLFGENVALLSFDDPRRDEHIVNSIRCLCSDAEPVRDALLLELYFVSLESVGAKHFLELTALCCIFGIGQNDAKRRLVFSSYSLESDRQHVPQIIAEIKKSVNGRFSKGQILHSCSSDIYALLQKQAMLL